MDQQHSHPGMGHSHPQGTDMSGHAKQMCERFMHVHVIATMRDGSHFDCIIDGMDGDTVILLVAEEMDEHGLMNMQPQPWRQPIYGRPRFRRFRRQRFPLSSFLFPFFVPFPYYYPPYPYYPPVVY